jgi:DNA-directed RNA polymerase specialized sigma24 family protein
MNKGNVGCCDLNMIISDFYNQLKQYVIKKINNNELAEDIVQEVMLKVIVAHQKNIQVKNLRAWLFQITICARKNFCVCALNLTLWSIFIDFYR